MQFQRLSDARLFHGWIFRAYGQQVVVRVFTNVCHRPDDTFAFEAIGRGIIGRFRGRLVSTEDVAGGDIGNPGCPLDAIDQGGKSIHIQIMGSLIVVPSSEAVRLSMQGLKASIGLGEDTHSVLVADVGPSGAGLHSEAQIPKGEVLTLTIQSPLGLFEFEVKVQNCRASRKVAGVYRIGVHFGQLGRLDRAKWNRFLEDWVDYCQAQPASRARRAA